MLVVGFPVGVLSATGNAVGYVVGNAVGYVVVPAPGAGCVVTDAARVAARTVPDEARVAARTVAAAVHERAASPLLRAPASGGVAR